MKSTLKEIKSVEIDTYKRFLAVGLLNDEEYFRISPNDDLHAAFPTTDLEDSFTLGVYIEDQLAGVVSFARDGSDREKLRHKGILFRMYVAAPYRGLGLARQLIEAVIARARSLEEMEQINLTVVANNDTAKGLYEKLGFKSFAKELNAIKWKGKYFDEEQMVLRLK